MSFGGGSQDGWNMFQGNTGSTGGGTPFNFMSFLQNMQQQQQQPQQGLPAPEAEMPSAMPLPAGPEAPAGPAVGLLPPRPDYGSGDFGRPSQRPADPGTGSGIADKIAAAGNRRRQASLNVPQSKPSGGGRWGGIHNDPRVTGRDKNGNSVSGALGLQDAARNWSPMGR